MRIARGTAVLLTYAASLLETFQDEDIRREGNLKSVGFCFPSQSHRRPFDSFLFTLELHNHASFYHTVKKKMSSNQNQATPPSFVYIPRSPQGQTQATFTYQEAGASAGLASWLSQPDSAAPFHNIGAYRLMTAASGSGAGMWGSASGPNSTGAATHGSGHGRQN
ncbi:hypothetical protein EsH8_VI_000158 [Colletotrichum jinshuiense]